MKPVKTQLITLAKYIADKKLPDKAIDVMDVACARLRLKGVKDGKIDHDEIIHEISTNDRHQYRTTITKTSNQSKNVR